MNSLLAKLLRRKGIDSIEQLSLEERNTFDKYEQVLNKKELTMSDLRQFIQGRIDHIETKWKDLSLDAQKKAEMIPYHTVYKTLAQAIDAPMSERAALEQVLMQQVQ